MKSIARIAILSVICAITVFGSVQRVTHREADQLALPKIVLAHADIAKNPWPAPTPDQIRKLVERYKGRKIEALWTHDDRRSIGYWDSFYFDMAPSGHLAIYATFHPSKAFQATGHYKDLLKAYDSPYYSEFISVSIEESNSYRYMTAAAFVDCGDLTTGLFDTGDPYRCPRNNPFFNYVERFISHIVSLAEGTRSHPNDKDWCEPDLL